MSRLPQLSDRRRFPYGFFGMIALIVGLEVQLQKCDVDLTPIWAADWRQAGRAARKEATRAEVLCFGDSLAKLGLAPRVIERESGILTYNLAVSVGQVPTSYFLLQRALKAGAEPKAIVIDMIPHLLSVEPGYNARLWVDFIEPLECLDLAYNAKDPDFFTSTMLGRYFPTIRNRHEVRSAILGTFRGDRSSNFPAIAWHWRNWRVNQGAQIMPSVDHFEGDANRWPAELYPESWQIHPVNEFYLDRLLILASLKNISVYLLVMPFSPEVHARRKYLGLDDLYSRFAQSVQDRHPNLVVLDARQSGYDQSLYIDPIHLDRQGASALSADLAAILNDSRSKNISPPRWVNMPFYHPRPDTELIEDLEQSQLALKQTGDSRRH